MLSQVITRKSLSNPLAPRRSLTLLAALTIILTIAACGSRSDSTVRGDLQALFTQKGIRVQSIDYCAHQNGSQYVCQVTMPDGSKRFAGVTDDGKTILEIGVR